MPIFLRFAILSYLFIISPFVYCQNQGIQTGSEAGCIDTYQYNFTDNEIMTRGPGMAISNEHIFVAGYVGNLDGFNDQTQSLIAKFNLNGDFISGKKIRYDNQAHNFKIIKLHDGNLLTLGYTGNTTLNGSFVFTKYDNDLNIIWEKFFERVGDLPDVVEGKDGSIFTSFTIFRNSHFDEIILVLKIDKNGTFQWFKSYELRDTQMRFSGATLVAHDDKLLVSTLFMEFPYYSTGLFQLNQNDGSAIWGRRFNVDNAVFAAIGSGSFFHDNKYYLCGMGMSKTNSSVPSVTVIDVNGNLTKTKFSLPQGHDSAPMFSCGMSSDGELIQAVSNVYVNSAYYHVFRRLDKDLNTINCNKRPTEGGFKNSGISNIIQSDDRYVYMSGSENDFMNPLDNNLFIRKLKYGGAIGTCPIDTMAWIDTVISVKANNVEVLVLDKQVNISALNRNELSYTTSRSEAFCTEVLNCDTLFLEGPQTLCNNSEVQTFYARKNAGCKGNVAWNFDPGEIEAVQRTDDSLKINFKKSGVIRLIASMNTGCKKFADTLFIKVSNAQNKINLGKDTVLCQGSSILLNAGPGFLSYHWQDASLESSYEVKTPGTFHVEAMNACGDTVRDTIVITPQQAPLISAGEDRTKCNVDTIHLSATPGFLSYSWVPNYTTNSTSTQTIIVNPLKDTSYVVKAEATKGCFYFDTVHIHVNVSANINLGNDTSFCAGDSIVLNAGNSFIKYLWNDGNTAVQKSAFKKGDYIVQAWDNNGCRATDTLKVLQVYTPPAIILPKDSVLCFNETRTLDA
ncbi:MAG TPA: hypothetical protein VEZ55_16090, partial [Chitinophagaceae bacterium]|nr:hypothetical protein [Chitinophagaceae bacterium]